MTNADKIRSMTNAQLADWIDDYVVPCYLCAYHQRNRCGDCVAGRLLWLKQEYKEGDDGKGV